jgi:hypothetical protein
VDTISKRSIVRLEALRLAVGVCTGPRIIGDPTPFGAEHILKTAEEYFEFLSKDEPKDDAPSQ